MQQGSQVAIARDWQKRESKEITRTKRGIEENLSYAGGLFMSRGERTGVGEKEPKGRLSSDYSVGKLLVMPPSKILSKRSAVTNYQGRDWGEL